MFGRFKLPTLLSNNTKWLERQQTTILSAALIIGIANIISSIAGLIRERLLISYFFDTSESRLNLEAFQVAFQIPDALFQLLVLGAVSASFIPIFTHLKKRDSKTAFASASIIMNVVLLVFVLVSAVIFVFAEPLTLFRTGSGFTPEQLAVAVQLTKIMLFAQFFFAISNFLSGILQSYQRFIVPALAPILYNFGIILGVALFSQNFGIYAAGIGVIIGALLHMAIQLPFAYLLGFRFTLSFNLSSPGVKKLFSLMPPRFITYAINELQQLSLGFFATSLGNLSFFVIRLALRLMTIPIRIFGVPIGQASLSFLSEESTDEDYNRFRSLLTQSLNHVAFLAFPASMLLLILRIPIVRLVFGASNLPWETTLATGRVVAIISLSVVAQALVQLLIRGFHALNDTKTPLYITLVTAITYLIGCWFFVFYTQIGLLGIALVILITAFLEMFLCLFLLDRKIGQILTKSFLFPQAKILLASFFMAVFLYLPFRILDELIFNTSKTVELIGLTITTSSIGLLVYLYFSALLNVRELQLVGSTFSSLDRWRKTLSRTTEVLSEPTNEEGLR
ncbi:MAG TPA: murein biosynthesis integral membrane protein MurJ [Candidatus Woesebacteria bacterium]|jgi:putative peptidoglycan lipid II flippase|nr:murein biosynthesis integral membrane protein MurJ [Candidatus Woesebacteria bacterium]HNS65296.1 murein biosynthesis integral membrane protein MurJ [Candidatus Woesebacteria bacterium]